MKKLTLIFLMISYFGAAQFFNSETDNESVQGNSFFHESPPQAPEQGQSDIPGNPGGAVPINQKWGFLVLGGAFVGIYFLYKHQRKSFFNESNKSEPVS